MRVSTSIAQSKKPQADPGSPASRSFWGDIAGEPAVVCVLLALVILAVFYPVGHHDFVNYDDADYVTANAHVQGGLTWENIRWSFTTGHASNWHPLTWVSHMLDCQLFGQEAGKHLLVNVAFHTVNTLLLFLILRRMTGAHWRSALVAALFALHPLHVESVAWVSERKDVLSTFWFLLTLGAYERYAAAARMMTKPGEEQNQKSEIRNPKEGRNPKSEARKAARTSDKGPSSPARALRFYFLALACFVLGLLSKPMLVTTPFILLLLDYWPLNRTSFSRPPVSSTPALQRSKTLARLLLEKLPFFALSLASCVVTFIVQRKGGAVSTSLPLGGRIANALVSYARYIGKMLWPENLSVLYLHPGYWPAWQVVAAGILVAAIFAMVVRLAWGRPYAIVGWLWFFGGLIPAIGLVQVGIQSMADRYTYIPMVGLFIALVWGLNDLIPAWRLRTEVLAASAAILLVAYALLTVRQVAFWRDSQALFLHAVEVTPRNYLAYNNLGFYLSGKGKNQEAMEYYRKSLEINPSYEDALNNMGYALAGQKNFPEAIIYYQRALAVRPNHAEVHNNLGNALSEMGRIDEAMQHYQVTLSQNPEHADAHNNLGIALAMKGQLDEAVVHFHAALRFKPNYASAHSSLGNALAMQADKLTNAPAAQRKREEAAREYRECLRLNPNDAQPHNNLGNVLAAQGKLDEAVAHYDEALRLNPNNPEAQFNLAVVLARQGKTVQAAAHCSEALRLKPDYAQARRQLELLQGRHP